MRGGKNAEGFPDPTATIAIGNVAREEKRKMLENYNKHMKPNEVIEAVERKHGCCKKEALSILRKEIPKEKYFQEKILKAIKRAYPEAYVQKITLGYYSQRGLPDILAIIDGHYFGFEVKRPIVGNLTAIQGKTRDAIRKAGGTAEVVSYPEEALAAIKDYFSWEG